MLVIPAIDLRGGRCVRLEKGAFDQQTTYSGDPVEVALHFQECGAKKLHVVDLDGAQSILTLNTELFPDSANTWDSLGEVSLYRGDRETALRHYRRALEVDPTFTNAAEQIEKILAETE